MHCPEYKCEAALMRTWAVHMERIHINGPPAPLPPTLRSLGVFVSSISNESHSLHTLLGRHNFPPCAAPIQAYYARDAPSRGTKQHKDQAL
jgi:hypothetical protein